MTARIEACLNCDTPLEDVWCPHCGQPNRRARLDPNDLAHDAFDQLIGLDTRIGRTLIDFSRRPGSAALAYVRGHRARYVNPLKYMLFAVAVYFLALKGFGITISELGPQQEQPPGQDPVVTEVVAAFLNFLNEGLRYILFTTPPVFAWVTSAFLGRRHFQIGKDGGLLAWVSDHLSATRSFNFAESCSLWMHVFAHSILIFTVPAICLVAAGLGPAIFWAILPTMAYYIWSAKCFYGRGWLYSGLIVLVAYVLFQLLFVATLIMSVIIAVWMSR